MSSDISPAVQPSPASSPHPKPRRPDIASHKWTVRVTPGEPTRADAGNGPELVLATGEVRAHQNEREANHHANGDWLCQEQDAEKERHDGVHVGDQS